MGQERHNFLDVFWRGSLVVIFDVDEDVVFVLAQVAHHLNQFGQIGVLRFDDPVPDLAGSLLHILPVAAVQPDNHRACQLLPELPINPEDRRDVVPCRKTLPRS